MGRREQKKEETRNILLEKARELFDTYGYQRVTTAEIARASGIAEGTLFNYYRNKGELFIAAMMPGASGKTPPVERLRDVSPHHLAAAIISLLDRELSGLGDVNKRLLRDYFAIVYGGHLSACSEARQGLLAADERTLKKLIDFLVEQKRAHPGKLADLNAELAASCVLGCAVALISQYMLSDDYSYERFKQSMYDQFLFILTGHVGA